jgi:transposase
MVFARVAGIDVHKRQVTVAVRVPKDQCGDGESRVQLVRRFPTFYGALREMAEWLRAQQITHVAMEATGIYWRPVFHALAEAEGFEIVLCNAHHVKNDATDAVWLAQLSEVGLLRGSFIPPAKIAALRELTRYRRKLTEECTREPQRLQKVLEDGGIKLDSVTSSATTRRSGRPGYCANSRNSAMPSRSAPPADQRRAARDVTRSRRNLAVSLV